MKKIFTSFILALLCVVVNAQTLTVYPENGASVDMLTDISLTWEEATTVTVDPALMVGGAKAYKVEGETKTLVSDIICGPIWGNSTVISFLSVVTDAGDYVVEICDNMFTVDDTPAAGFTLDYTIGGIPSTSSTFAIEMKDNSVSTLLVTVEPCSELMLNPEATESIQIIHNNGFAAYYAAVYTPEVTGANTATLTADKTLGDGNYTLIIPKGTFIVDGKINREILKEFDLSVVNPADKYSVSPANGSIVDELIEIVVTWEDATAIDINVDMMMGGIKVYQIGAEEKILASEVFCGPAWGNDVILTLTSPIDGAGDYEVVIPDNMITVDGTPVPAFSLLYTVSGLPISSATIKAQLQDESLSTILLTFEPCAYLSLYEPVEGEEIEAPFIIANLGFSSYIAATYTITITGENTAVLTTDTELPAGNYTLHVTRNNFLIDGALNKLTLFDFDNSAVEKVLNDNAPLNVYDLRGVQVVTNGDVNEVKGLDSGIYIVNGKKIFVRNNK